MCQSWGTVLCTNQKKNKILCSLKYFEQCIFIGYLSHLMGKPTICIGENKGADQLCGNRELISAFVFATRIVQFLFYLNPKFQASSSFLCLYRPVCVGPVRKPHCWFSHEAAHLYVDNQASCFVVVVVVFLTKGQHMGLHMRNPIKMHRRKQRCRSAVQ